MSTISVGNKTEVYVQVMEIFSTLGHFPKLEASFDI